ncbi:hypothetical protein Y032_0066g3765 [Ancylostoma ceylanicum]|uniref:Cyanocobalamin reductase (cyanide-eliminating) n=1 Tax=Ancylostoma ceylanicum TaxID=53326 RepID=A0A016U030_9BILA|nr:hypothetical protein Y032_0066g3765 [Ancylostoma ceylanicum]
MPPNAAPAHEEVFFVKDTIDAELPEQDGFESHLFTIGEYNKVVGEPFKLPHDPDSAAILIISTPNMFDVSFKRWFLMKCKELGSVEAVAENVSSPIQEFLEYRLEPLCRKFDALSVEYELLHDYSLWANRKPKILMQTCGHVSGAAFFYQPFQVGGEGWPPYLPKGKKKIDGLRVRFHRVAAAESRQDLLDSNLEHALRIPRPGRVPPRFCSHGIRLSF